MFKAFFLAINRNLNDPSYQNQSRGGSFGSDIGKTGIEYITDTYDKNKKEIGLKVRDAYTLVRKAADYFLPHKDDLDEKKSHEAIDVDKALDKVKAENLKRKKDIELSKDPKYGDLIYKLKEPLKSEDMYNKKKQIKKFETGTFGVANNNNQAATERKLHQQNGTWSNLSSIPLVGKPLANGMNFMQGWGKAQYDRNESIANMKMDRLSNQAGAMQEGFRTQGMRNTISNTQFGNQDENDLYSTVNNKAKKGKNQMKDKALIEVEKDEFIFRPKGKGYKLVGDMKGGKTHEQGGEPVVAKEGDVIFPAKDRKLIAPLIGPGGSVRDLKRFEALRSRLPEDKPSDVRKGQMEAKASPNGAILGTGMNLTEGFREGTYEKYGDGTVKLKNNKVLQKLASSNKDKLKIKAIINTPPSPSTSGRGPRTGTTTGNPGPTIIRPSSGAPVPPPPIKATGRFTNSSPGSKSFKAPTQGSIFYDTEMGGVRFKIDPLTNERVYLGEFYDENTKKNLKGGAKKAGEREPLRSNSKALVQRREIESKNAKTFPLSKHNVVAPEVSKTQKLLDKFVPKTKLGKIGMLTALGGLASETYNILNSDDTPIEKTKKVATKVGEAVTSAAMPGDSGVVDVKIDSLRRRLATVQKDSILHKDDPKSLAQLGREADTLIKQIKALGGDTSSTIQHSGRTQYVIDSLQTTPSDTTKTPTPKIEPEAKTPATQSAPSRNTPAPSSYVPTPRYSKLHTTGVKRGKFQLEPTDAENKKYNPDDRRYDDEYSPEGVRTKKGKGANAGNYDDFKVSKIKEIREAGHDISEYEGANDIETFYNLYNDRKVNKPKSKEDKLLQEALREEEGNKPSITKPKPMEVDPDSKPPKIYQDEELPEWISKKRIPEGKQYDSRKDKPGVTQKLPDRVEIERSETPKEYFERRTREDRNNAKKLKHGSKSLKEYSKGSYSVKHGVEHEQRELRNFDDIQKELNSLKRMHKGIPKAEYGTRGVPGNMGGNLHNMGYQSPNDPAQQTMSTDSSMMPTPIKRQVPPMQGIKPMPVPAYTPPPITPTMPTLDEPKGPGTPNPAKAAVQKAAKGGWGIKGFDTAGFNQAVGLSRQKGDRYTDKYTDIAGGGRVNQYDKGSKKLVLPKYENGKKGKQVQQGNVGGGGVAPVVRVEQGRISTRSILGKDHKLGSAPTTFSSTRPTDEQILRDQRAAAVARGIGDKFDAWLKQTTPTQAANDIWTKPGHNFGQGFTPDIKTEVVKEPDTTTVVPSGGGALGQSQSSVDQGVNNNSKALSQDLGHTVQNQTYADFEGADFSQEAMTKEEAEARKKAAIKGGRFQLRNDKRDKRAFNEAYKDSYKGYRSEGLSHSQAEEKALAHAQSRFGGGDKKDFTALAKNAFEGTERKALTLNVGNTNIGSATVDNSQGPIGNNDSSSSVEGDTKNTKDSGNSPSTKISSKDDNSLKVDVNAPTDVNAPVVLPDGSSKATTPTSTTTPTTSTTTTDTNGVNSNAIGDITAPSNSVSDKIEKDTEGNKLEKKKRGTKKLVLNKYRSGTEDVKANGSATGSGTNSNSTGTVNAPSTSTSGPIHKTTTGGSFVVHKTPKPKPEDEVKPGKPEETKPSKPIDVGDFKMPKWKTPHEKNDPMVSPDDVTAVKTNLYRNNYQDSSAPQRQEISSLMSGGGFDSSNQIANKINKEKALSKVNADEQNRLAAVNESNTAILNTEKQLNMGNQIAAMNARDENKGVADAANYNAVLRNNQRANDKPMKDLSYNMAQGQYAMMEPMMKLQMQQAQMANEYMRNGMKGPGSYTPFTPTPKPASTPTREPAPAVTAVAPAPTPSLAYTGGITPNIPTELPDPNAPIKRKGSKKLKLNKKR